MRHLLWQLVNQRLVKTLGLPTEQHEFVDAPLSPERALPAGSEHVTFLALLALALTPAVIGMTEEVPMGLLPEISQDLHVSLSATGMLVSGYALGVVIGAPLLAVCTIRLPRKQLLLGAIAFYLVENLLNAVIPI